MNDPIGQTPQDGQDPSRTQAGPQDHTAPVVGTYGQPPVPVAPSAPMQPGVTREYDVSPLGATAPTPAPMPPSYSPQVASTGPVPTPAPHPQADAQPMAAPMVAPSNPQVHQAPLTQQAAPEAAFSQHAFPAAPPVEPKPKSERLWLKIGAASLAAACAASLGTAALTGAFSADPVSSATPQATTQPQIAIPVADSTSQNPNWSKVSQAVSGSVVAITVEFGGSGAEGSGVIYDAEGHIVTNNHVIEGGTNGKITVSLADGRIYDATIVGTDPATDLAVIKITNPPADLKPATFGDSDKVVVGEAVIAIGNPLGLSNTATTGIVSALNRPVQTGTTQENASVSNAIQIDAAVNPGNSGGPAFNAQGQVIGITSSIATLSQSSSGQSGSIGLGFAIPVNVAHDVAQQIISTGKAKHAFLGVTLAEGTATVGDTTTRGAQVTSVTPNTPASDASLQVGDVITHIDGTTVSGSVSLSAYVRSRQSGDVVTLTFVRNGESRDVKVTLAEREDTTATPAPTPTPQNEKQGDDSQMFDPFGLFGGGQSQGGN